MTTHPYFCKMPALRSTGSGTWQRDSLGNLEGAGCGFSSCLITQTHGTMAHLTLPWLEMETGSHSSWNEFQPGPCFHSGTSRRKVSY